MFVAENLKKYFSIFFKSMFFLLLILLIAHLGDFLNLPSNAGKLTTFKAGLQLVLNLVILLIPATLIIVSGLFFAFPYSISRGLLFKVIPLIVFLNTLFLSAFIFYPNHIAENTYPIQKEVQPQFEKNKIYEFNNTAFYINDITHSNQLSGLFIMQHPFFVENARYTPPLLTLHSSMHYEGDELMRQNIHIKVPISLKNRPAQIFPFGLTLAKSISIDFIHTKRVFESVFPTKKPIISILSLFLFNLGFFAFVLTLSLFFKDRKIYILHLSLLSLFIVGEYLILAPAVNIIALINFGIKNQTLALLIPSLITSILGILLSFLIIQFKIPKPIKPVHQTRQNLPEENFDAPTF